MTTTTLLAIIGFLFFLIVIGQIIAKKREADTEANKKVNGERVKKESGETSFWSSLLPKISSIKWATKTQAIAIAALFVAMVTVLFWEPLKTAFSAYPLIIWGMIIAMVMLLIGGDPAQTIRRLRKVALWTVVGLLAWFVIWPGITKNTPIDQLTKALVSGQENKNGGVAKKSTDPLHSTGITLKPGEVIGGFKKSDMPTVSLILRYPNGQERIYPGNLWHGNMVAYRHTGPENQVEVFYRGQAGKYQFKKISSAPGVQVAAYKQPPNNRQPNCPF